jgi:excisionase family DNA binding protein
MIPLVTRIAALERKVEALEAREQPSGYLSMRNAAAYLGISYHTLKDHVRRGRFSVVKMGSGQNARVLLSRSEIERVVRKHTVNGAAREERRA